jgi:type IX secretion system PorP/SprF family membrane protein
MSKIYLYIFSLSFSFVLFSQQEPLVTNFMFNKLNYNPGATGIDDGISATLIYRNQWDKVVGAPNTTFFNIDANLNKVFYGNYGLTFMNDVIGNFRQNNLLFNFGAPFQIKEAGYLNFGIGLGYVNLSLDPNWITPSGNTNDPTLPKSGSGSNFYANFGLVWKSFKGYYVGFSSSYLNTPTIRDLNMHFVRHYFFLTGHRFKNLIGPNKDLELQTIVRTELIKTSADLNFKYYHANLFYAGLTYRTFESVAFLAGFYPIKNFTLGYSYDLTINGLSPVSNGTHELVARYRYVIPDPPLERTKHPRWL